jgi:hypothetical protein
MPIAHRLSTADTTVTPKTTPQLQMLARSWKKDLKESDARSERPIVHRLPAAETRVTAHTTTQLQTRKRPPRK